MANFKRIGLQRKRADLSHEQFVAHWVNVHAELAKRLPKLRRYSINVIDRARNPDFGYDGFSELWFDSEEDLVAALASPEGKALLADLPNLTNDIYPIIAVEHRKLDD
jgi:uncharacterized protein (TIGR02118 family)